MHNPITPAELEAWRALCEDESLPVAPWHIVREDIGDDIECFVPTEMWDGNGVPIIDNEGGLAPDCTWTSDRLEALAAFIAESRTAFPRMIDEIRRLRALARELATEYEADCTTSCALCKQTGCINQRPDVKALREE